MNFTPAYLNGNDVLQRFEKEVELLWKDVEDYKKNPKASERFVFYKMQKAKIFHSILDEVTLYLDDFMGVFLMADKDLAKQKNDIAKLEGICLLHGIWDLQSYMRCDLKGIEGLVKEAHEEGWAQTPIALTLEKRDPVNLTDQEWKDAYLKGGIRAVRELQYPKKPEPVFAEKPLVDFNELLKIKPADKPL